MEPDISRPAMGTDCLHGCISTPGRWLWHAEEVVDFCRHIWK